MELEKRALIVEDDEKTRDFVTLALAKRGYLCDVASNLEQGLIYLNQKKYDVIITDNHFPEKERFPEEPNMGVKLISNIKFYPLQENAMIFMYSSSFLGLSSARSMGAIPICKNQDDLNACLTNYLNQQE